MTDATLRELSSGDGVLRIRLFISAVAAFLALAVAAPAGAAPRFVPGELLVRFQGGAGAAAQADTLGAKGARIARSLPLRGLKLVRLPAGASVAEAIAAFDRDPDVLYAQPNFVYEVVKTPNDPLFGNLWALNQTSDVDIDAPEAWDVTTGSADVTVAVVDTGVDYNHPDLVANAWSNPGETPSDGVDNDGNGRIDDARGWDFVGDDSAPLDENGHGSHAAGTIGARGDNLTGVVGVNWHVSLMSVRAGDADGELTDERIVRAFEYARAEGARVVNGSFGGPQTSPAVLDSINAAPNVLFVFAAGNGGKDRKGDNNDSSPVYPCNFQASNVVCVAATGSLDSLADFSNYGATSVDVAAPGVGIQSTVPGGMYGWGNGTSMAAPHVAGVAALVLAAKPGLSAGGVGEAILTSADRLAALTGKVATGGRLNAAVAVATAQSMTELGSPPPPPPPSPPPPPPAPVPPPPAPLPPPPPPPPRVIDTRAPNTTITRAPARRTTSRTARFRFVSSEAGSTFRCKLDRRVWRACRSPRTYRYLRRGWHTVRIRARDAAGNVDRTPAVRTWRIV